MISGHPPHGLRALNLPKEALPMYRLLRKNPRTLTAESRWNLRCWLADKPVLGELCAAGEAIFSLSRVTRPSPREQGPDALHRHFGALVGT